MANINISYIFRFEDGSENSFRLCLDDRTAEMLDPKHHDGPEWTRLEYHQCSHCPLNGDRHEYCPAALSLIDCVAASSDLMSFDRVSLEVRVDKKVTSIDTTVQKGLSSLIGLLLSSSGCPYLKFFKPMGRQHLPLASEKDTIFRAVGMYLLAQYYLQDSGNPPDLALKGLKNIYEKLQVVNLHLANRVREASETDSSVNAVILLDLLSKALPMVIEDKLEDIHGWFDIYHSELFTEILKE
ncbi:DUF6901 family protein [Hahella ganghwensis]|uniref:DUF6901 family protein n=1 Tax=Hahella ganghwensis TaxID=286420 RepID=UPI00035E9FBA|nr:hypothetical protein [Hahella ganghwensis]